MIVSGINTKGYMHLSEVSGSKLHLSTQLCHRHYSLFLRLLIYQLPWSKANNLIIYFYWIITIITVIIRICLLEQTCSSKTCPLYIWWGVLSWEPFMFTQSRNSFLWRHKRHLRILPNRNQKEGEQRVYVDSFCSIIRKAGATLSAATSSVPLEAVCFFPLTRGIWYQGGKDNYDKCVCVSVCVVIGHHVYSGLIQWLD